MTRKQLIIQSIQKLREANPGIKSPELGKIVGQACTDPEWKNHKGEPYAVFTDTANAYLHEMKKAETWVLPAPSAFA